MNRASEIGFCRSQFKVTKHCRSPEGAENRKKPLRHLQNNPLLKMSTIDFDLQKVETQVLKVHINCDGCKQKVKKLLRRIEGVYTVDIDTEQHVVIVTGTVDSDTLIKKLGRSGKHAEIWQPKTYQNQNPQEQEQATTWIRDGRIHNQMQCPIKGFKGYKRSHMLGPKEAEDGWGYFGDLSQNPTREAMIDDGMGQTIMLNTEMGNIHAAGNGYVIDGHHANSMQDNTRFMGFQGFGGNNDVGLQHLHDGLPSFEHHHPSSYMVMNNMQGHQYNYNQPSLMMTNMDMHAMNKPLMNHYMHMHQPQMIYYPSSFPTNTEHYGNFTSLPYLPYK